MRLLIDANVPYPVISYLRQKKHEVVSVLEQNGNEIDEKILEQAVHDNRTVVTFDKDFGELVFRLGLPHKGVVLLEQFFAEHSNEDIQGHFWVLSESHTRKAKSQ